jgi:hypothetical protein
MRRRLDVVGVERRHLGRVIEDHAELLGEIVELGIVEREARQRSNVLDIGAREVGHRDESTDHYDAHPTRIPGRRGGTVPAYPFLSDEWFVEARRVLEDDGVQVPEGAAVRLNAVVTDTPFGADRLLHVVIGGGAADWDHGLLDDADLTITTDYTTARDLFIAGEPAGALQALMEGKLKLQGDLTKLMGQMAGTGPGSPGLGAALGAITA